MYEVTSSEKKKLYQDHQFSQEKLPHTLIPVIASTCCGKYPVPFFWATLYRVQAYSALYTLKTSGSEIDPERVHWAKLHSGSTMTRKLVKMTNNGVRLTQLLVKFRVKWTDFRVIVDPEWSLAPMDPSQGIRFYFCL